MIYGGGGNDYLEGDSGYDRIYGGTGNDQLIGSDGNDLLVDQGSRSGHDRLIGGLGNDNVCNGDPAPSDFYYQCQSIRTGSRAVSLGQWLRSLL